MGNPLIYLRKENVFMGNYLSGIKLNAGYMNKHRTAPVRRATVSRTHTHRLLPDTWNEELTDETKEHNIN